MIAYLAGKLLESTENSCMLLTSGGVGYEVFLSTHMLSRLPEKGGELELFIHTVVREDALELFGFESWDERDIFQTLIAINRVGARTALSVLGTFRPDDLRRLVIEDDANGLTRVSGIGKKSAQQIFLELKYKLKIDSVPVKGVASPMSSMYSDALAALGNLGYAEDEAATVVREVLAAEPDLELGSILRAALKRMAKRV